MLTSEEEIAISTREKAEIVVKTIHGSGNLTQEGRRRRERTVSQYPGVLDRRDKMDHLMDKPFSLAEVTRAINRTSPGKYQM